MKPSTTRLEKARFDFEAAHARLGAGPMYEARVRDVPHVVIGPGSRRALPTRDGDGILPRTESGLPSEVAVNEAYGAGRAYERAIQEARFGAYGLPLDYSGATVLHLRPVLSRREQIAEQYRAATARKNAAVAGLFNALAKWEQS